MICMAVVLASGCGDDDYQVGSAAWELRSPVAPDATDLPISVFVGSSSCSRLDDLVVTESRDAVTIDARVRSATGRDCTADLRIVPAAVALGGPLGDRRLLGCDERPGLQGEERDCLDPGELSQP